ncbi:DUF5133 domain-containing protein [Streptomyces goshikiensis]
MLSTATLRTGLPETVLAAASRGIPVLARAERALRQAVRTVRTSDHAPSLGPYLLPVQEDAEKALGRFFEARLRLTAAPADPKVRRAFEGSLFALCVRMGRPCPANPAPSGSRAGAGPAWHWYSPCWMGGMIGIFR